MSSLELGLIGNCSIGALVDGHGEIVWGCFPRFDGDAVFCSLLRPQPRADEAGFFRIELADVVAAEQSYLPNTAILLTRLTDSHGGAIEITDFAPRFFQHGRLFAPMALMRRVRRVSGNPRIVVRLRPAHSYGAGVPDRTRGTHHIRYMAPDLTLRLTTDASITAVLQETPFLLAGTRTFYLGPDETVDGGLDELGRRFLTETADHWRRWVRGLAIPFEWQEEVIRAAITLKLNAYEDTGAIIAAMTTSIPEHPGSPRNWDYRYCWVRDGYFVVNALNRLGATETMERYLDYILNLAANTPDGILQPVYGIDGRAELEEAEIDSLPGYRGMGPVRVGNRAYVQVQHDVYGSAILAGTHVFFDRRLSSYGDRELYRRMERLGEQAARVYEAPDAGIWELRGTSRPHTYSSLMCWAACDRLARVARHLGLPDRADYWSQLAARIHGVISERGWNPARKAFTGTFGGEAMDASLLLMTEFQFLQPEDPRFASTVAAIESELKRGNFVFRYVEQDDFGVPENAFLVCTYWYIYALTALKRYDEARELFEHLLACRTKLGLLAEHIEPTTGELWGNFVQTYSMVGLITGATRLSLRWDQAF